MSVFCPEFKLIIKKWLSCFGFTEKTLKDLGSIIDSPHRADSLDNLLSAIVRQEKKLVVPIKNNMYKASIMLGPRDSCSNVISSSALIILVQWDENRNKHIVRGVKEMRY